MYIFSLNAHLFGIIDLFSSYLILQQSFLRIWHHDKAKARKIYNWIDAVHKKEKYGQRNWRRETEKCLDKYTKSLFQFHWEQYGKTRHAAGKFFKKQSWLKLLKSTGKVFPDFARIFLFQFISPFHKNQKPNFSQFYWK